jgi:predicted ATP-grasp superfamily ATP-dependent carboligase
MLVRSRAAVGDDGYEQLTDKATLLELAEAHMVPVPRGSVVASVAEAARVAAHLGYPVILKPARSRMLISDRIVATSVCRAQDAAELQQLLEVAPWFPQLPVIVQEYVPGHGTGIFCLYDRDRALAWFAHRRLREKPPSGGVSVLCESVPVDPTLQDYADSLLRAARYRGVAMVEFRMGNNGRPYIMEVNARFWGSLQLAIDCGVDFPWLYYQMMTDAPVVAVADYAVGRRLRWLLGDVDNLLIQLRDPALRIVEKLSAMRRFGTTTFDRSCRQEVFHWSDPAPALREARQWLAATLGRSP